MSLCLVSKFQFYVSKMFRLKLRFGRVFSRTCTLTAVNRLSAAVVFIQWVFIRKTCLSDALTNSDLKWHLSEYASFLESFFVVYLDLLLAPVFLPLLLECIITNSVGRILSISLSCALLLHPYMIK